MKKIVVAILAISVLLSVSLLVLSKPVSGATDTQNSWFSKAVMNRARAYLGVATVNGKIYAIGGDQGSYMGNVMNALAMTYDVTNVTEEYDPNLDRWVVKAQMPTARARFGTAVYQNKIYCIGGYRGEVIVINAAIYESKTNYYDVEANEVYDPATNTWEVRTPLPTPRESPATNMVDGKIYVIGGYSIETKSYLNVFEVYDPETDTWAVKLPPPIEVVGSASAVVDNKIFVLGEKLTGDENHPVQYVIQTYDPAIDIWSIKGTASTFPWASAAATTGVNSLKRIYFFSEDSNAVYDPSNDSWNAGDTSPLSQPVASAVVVDELIYVVGGRMGQWGYMTDMRPSARTQMYVPFGYGSPDPSFDTTAPEIAVSSPENKTYYNVNVTLSFSVNESTSRTSYSLDGLDNVTVVGNTTVVGLSVGLHNVTVYAWDTAGNVGSSETITFSISEPEPKPSPITPFPTTLVIASVITIAVVGIVLLFYFKKRKH
jgi:N-acetylneuraminic acid mutarotase